ncbi:actin depolymerization factor/cofilin-like domain-containing protein [Phanerochaete sordida]|uniref:Cofilin n=1 Tax=Phanerochaete sordida TaxID=48140 RepID=A0A9P3LAJ6_9APHY|nr:actin depolymerization factor/cofilin-like domain-containing protein [Phanerochaete sordida]
MSSGVSVSDDCITSYQELMKRKHKYVVYGLNPTFTEIVVLKTSQDADYELFIKEFPNDQCRWAVYDLEYEADDGGKRNKVVFVYWSPGQSSIKQRMVYSASNNALKARLGVALEIQGNDEEDLEFVNVLEKAKRNSR